MTKDGVRSRRWHLYSALARVWTNNNACSSTVTGRSKLITIGSASAKPPAVVRFRTLRELSRTKKWPGTIVPCKIRSAETHLQPFWMIKCNLSRSGRFVLAELIIVRRSGITQSGWRIVATIKEKRVETQRWLGENVKGARQTVWR